MTRFALASRGNALASTVHVRALVVLRLAAIRRIAARERLLTGFLAPTRRSAHAVEMLRSAAVRGASAPAPTAQGRLAALPVVKRSAPRRTAMIRSATRKTAARRPPLRQFLARIRRSANAPAMRRSVRVKRASVPALAVQSPSLPPLRSSKRRRIEQRLSNRVSSEQQEQPADRLFQVGSHKVDLQ